jgi:predicted metal-dependent peptidase
MVESDDIETKLSAARTRLILDKPFLGALVLRLPMIAADPAWCKTTATDARAFYYNPAYIRAISLDHTQFMLAHEALHCALSHFARRQHRVKHRWDVACDNAINPLLVKDGLHPPPGTLLLDAFDGMTAEEIYPYIDENNSDEPLDQHLYDEDDSRDDQQKQQQKQQNRAESRQPEDAGEQGDQPQQREGAGGGSDGEPEQKAGKQKSEQYEGAQARDGEPDPDTDTTGNCSCVSSTSAIPGGRSGAPQPPPLSETERENLSVQWRQRLAGAAQQAQQAGKMSGSMARMVDHLLQPQLPWRMLLARYMSASARDDYSFMRPSRREGTAILPSLRSSQVELSIFLDTSGSIGDGEMREFLAEVNALKGQMRARITLHACDDHVSEGGPWQFEVWDELRLPASLQGGGGTSFVPAFEWLERQDRQPDLLLYFTDAEGEFPKVAPYFPVIWLVKGKARVPWGQRIQLN